MTLTLTVPATLFPAISFLLLSYTNRYLALASLIRNLLAEWKTTSDARLVAQIAVLRRRITLIKFMQTFAVVSMLCAVVSIQARHDSSDSVYSSAYGSGEYHRGGDGDRPRYVAVERAVIRSAVSTSPESPAIGPPRVREKP